LKPPEQLFPEGSLDTCSFVTLSPRCGFAPRQRTGNLIEACVEEAQAFQCRCQITRAQALADPLAAKVEIRPVGLAPEL
jgi:hypothetical protein